MKNMPVINIDKDTKKRQREILDEITALYKNKPPNWKERTNKLQKEVAMLLGKKVAGEK